MHLWKAAGAACVAFAMFVATSVRAETITWYFGGKVGEATGTFATLKPTEKFDGFITFDSNWANVVDGRGYSLVAFEISIGEWKFTLDPTVFQDYGPAGENLAQRPDRLFVANDYLGNDLLQTSALFNGPFDARGGLSLWWLSEAGAIGPGWIGADPPSLKDLYSNKSSGLYLFGPGESGSSTLTGELGYLSSRPRPAPEPGTVALLGLTLLGIGATRFRRAGSRNH
jgi:hypothetical protein